jgi:hypothetical protein
MTSRIKMYETIEQQATLAEAGGLAKERSVLLLWFMRNVVGIGELEAYDYVCDGDNDKGIDGLFLERSGSDESSDTLVIFQSKYTESSSGVVGPTDIDRLAGNASYFVSSNTLDQLLNSGLEVSLAQLINMLGLVPLLEDSDSPLRVRLVLVTTGTLNGDAKRKVDALRELNGDHYVEVWDIDQLGPLAEAVKSPERLAETISIPWVGSEFLVTGTSPNRVAMIPVLARDVADWPGIESRQLFALNVRHELKANRVSKALDGAISRSGEHGDFLSYHNGITVVCDSFREDGMDLYIERPSVVNGAQSVLAFRRGAVGGLLTDDLRVFMKVVEVAGRPTVEKEVGRRSNTQSGVNPRNLMANHGTQLRLVREFENDYPGVLYETRPDVQDNSGYHVIANDEAAQLLCAIFNEWPWLAVKKNSLFENENHPQIFSEKIHARHIIFADHIKSAVQEQRGGFPEDYRKSWMLTRITACYLVGQALRASGLIPDLLSSSRAELEDATLMSALDDFAYCAAVAMCERNDDLGEADDFKKDFKNETQLKQMGVAVRKVSRLRDHFKGR